MVRKFPQTARARSIGTLRAFERSPATNVFAACLAIFCAYVPLTSIAVALPTIQTRLGASSSQLTWVLDALVVPMAAVKGATRLGKRSSRRRERRLAPRATPARHFVRSPVGRALIPR